LGWAFLGGCTQKTHQVWVRTGCLNPVYNKKAQLTQRERATAVHV